ncbi:MAG: hypothetical protein PHO74_01385 [Weeksellaceae bacterium]|jgi:hypothetical protein|nr:hypothetical protein [Weeksellaceae bacterium]
MKNRLLTLLMILLPVINLFAQVPPPPDYGEDAGTPGTPSTPVDQYVILLIVAGILFATFYLWKQRKLVSQ